jgi:hypothetical protein
MTALHPGGARGKRFQLYGPQMASYADMLGLIQEALIKLRVVSTCDVSLSHSCRGNSLSVVARALMKIFERLDGTFCRINTVVVWLNEHELAIFVG